MATSLTGNVGTMTCGVSRASRNVFHNPCRILKDLSDEEGSRVQSSVVAVVIEYGETIIAGMWPSCKVVNGDAAFSGLLKGVVGRCAGRRQTGDRPSQPRRLESELSSGFGGAAASVGGAWALASVFAAGSALAMRVARAQARSRERAVMDE